MTLPTILRECMSQSDIIVSELQLVLANSYRQDFSISQDFSTPPVIPRECILQSGIAISDLELILTKLLYTKISKTRCFQVTPTLPAIPRECMSQSIDPISKVIQQIKHVTDEAQSRHEFLYFNQKVTIQIEKGSHNCAEWH
ncbi:hypothetical protein EV1_013838 [Malus domestica]